jgi:hypothetical protein
LWEGERSTFAVVTYPNPPPPRAFPQQTTVAGNGRVDGKRCQWTVYAMARQGVSFVGIIEGDEEIAKTAAKAEIDDWLAGRQTAL